MAGDKRGRLVAGSRAPKAPAPAAPWTATERCKSSDAEGSSLFRSLGKFVSRHFKGLATNEFVEFRPVLVVPTSEGSSRIHLRSDSTHCFIKSTILQNADGSWKIEAAATDTVVVRRRARQSIGNGNGSVNIQVEDRSSPPLRILEDLLDVENDLSFFKPADNKLLETRNSEQEIQVQRSSSVAVPGSNKSSNITMQANDDTTQKAAAEVVKPVETPKFRMGDNAIAGGLAGMFVSMFLHPLDTVKTVLQSQSSARQPLFSIASSIISTRGVSGLYRGLGTNLASSAPISAIYACTYESVKSALLPRLPKDYHYLAHCAAGGCASIATSLVYTPSERVKQQMQIGAVYRNSGLALVRILQKEGVPGLYAGWGAVLCRNVPQSVIKFLTYESLKRWALCKYSPDAHLSNLQTLAFGGLAGSTAALFTTPFDVVKTRLQTQAIGSAYQYTSVWHALQQIATEEGLQSLYRGLTPRLVIYVSQGALFFASYEFFKRALAGENRLHLVKRPTKAHVPLEKVKT